MFTSVFPSINNYITPRSKEVTVDSNNCAIILPQKVSEINRVLVKADNLFVRVGVFNDAALTKKYKVSELYAAPNDAARFEYVDITKYVVEQAKYNTLPLIKSDRDGDLVTDVSINNASYYIHNEDTLHIINQKIDNQALDCFQSVTVWNMTIASAVCDRLTVEGVPYTKNSMGIFTTSEGSIRRVDLMTNNPMDAQFRIYYTPLGESVKLQVPKTNPQANQFCIPYSQQQPIVDNVTLGREMQSVANRAGCETKEIVRTLRSMKEYRKPGAVYFEQDSSGNPTGNVWRLTSNHIEIYSETFIQVVETWSKNWSYRSQNVPINREFRSWNIPADIVQRNLLWQDYCLITRKVLSDDEWDDTSLLITNAKKELMRGLNGEYSGSIATECNNMWFYTTEGNFIKGAALSCSAFGFGNSLVFSGKTKDNLSAGVQRVDSENDGSYQFCKDFYYCNADGTLDTMYIQIGSALRNLITDDNKASYAYPEAYSDERGVVNMFGEDNAVYLFRGFQSFNVLKDPCEQLNFTYQLHLLTDDGMLVIGSAWAAGNPLVKQRDQAQTVKVWKLTSYLPQGAQVMTKAYGSKVEDANLKNSLFKVHMPDNSGDDPTIQFNIANADGTSPNTGVGVCVTDEHDNVLIAFNSNDPATFNVKFTHDYGAIAKALTKASTTQH